MNKMISFSYELKHILHKYFFVFMFLIALLCFSCVSQQADSDLTKSNLEQNQKEFTMGYLLIAHGFTNDWNNSLKVAVKALTNDSKRLFELCFLENLMDNAGESYVSPKTAYNKLVMRGANNIIVVPLFVDSHSNHIDEVLYVTRLAELEDPEPKLKEIRITSKMPPIAGITKAMDGHPSIGKGLAIAISKLNVSNQKNFVILAAHGPNTDKEELHWIENLSEIMNVMTSKLPAGFIADSHYMTLRVHDSECYHERLRELSTKLKVYLAKGEVFLCYNHIKSGYLDTMVVKGSVRSPLAFPGVLNDLTEVELSRLHSIDADTCNMGILPEIIETRISEYIHANKQN